MESEKVKEIKKVLECCSKLTDRDLPEETRDNACNSCPYTEIERCTPVLVKNALTYINELESVNKWLLCKAKEKNNEIDNYTKENEQLKERIAMLENQMCRNEDLHNATEKLNDMIILKQFAERVKMEFYYEFGELIPSIMSDKIDKLLKELQGE